MFSISIQSKNVIEATHLFTKDMSNLAADQIETLKELSCACEEAVLIQLEDQIHRGADVTKVQPMTKFGSSAWADRMDRQERLVKKFEVSIRQFKLHLYVLILRISTMLYT